MSGQSNDSMNWYERVLRNDLLARLVGLGLALFGVAVAWIFVYLPLKQAMKGQPATLYYVALGIPQMFIYVGFVQLVAGRHSGKFLMTRHGGEWTRPRVVTYTIGTVFCLGLFLAAQTYLKSVGFFLK